MPPQKVRLKKPLPSPKLEEEEYSPKKTLLMFIEALQLGEFDSDLDTLYEAVDARIAGYQQEEGDPGHDPRNRASASVSPVEGKEYYVRGDRYAGVVVVFLEPVPQHNGDSPKALVEVALAIESDLVVGQRYRVPIAALQEIPVKQPQKVPGSIGYSFCKGCQERIEYSGTGRPKSYCENCRAPQRKAI